MRQSRASRGTHRHAAPAVLGRRQAPRKRGFGRVVAGLLLVVLVLAIAAGSVGWYLLYRPDSKTIAGKPVHVVIESGTSTAGIAQILSDAGVVENAMMFRTRMRLAEADGLLRAGEYDLSTGMPFDQVLKQLSAGPQIVTFDVPIPEGFTLKQIAARFAARANVPEDELLTLMTTGAEEYSDTYPYLAKAYRHSLEGYLFPATYTVKEGTTAHEVVAMMLEKFDTELSGIDLSFAKSKNLDVNDIVIIASILERESKIKKEFPLVSSVIYNRLKKPMRLQLCATVLYELPEGTTKLTNADLKLNSPYNTYLHDGLPAGPISNPGLAALKAAAAPAKTNYYYYVLTGKDGSQTFASTYDEFLKAKQVYKQVFGD